MNVFTYGSLMFPDIWQRVAGDGHRFEPAFLPGYARYEIRGVPYPGLVRQKEAAVSGMLYFNVDDVDLRKLDIFEGAEYRRETVTVSLSADYNVVAETYVFMVPERLTMRTWDPQTFPVTRFIDTYCPDI